jgi:hypothetical protein
MIRYSHVQSDAHQMGRREGVVLESGLSRSEVMAVLRAQGRALGLPPPDPETRAERELEHEEYEQRLKSATEVAMSEIEQLAHERRLELSGAAIRKLRQRARDRFQFGSVRAAREARRAANEGKSVKTLQDELYRPRQKRDPTKHMQGMSKRRATVGAQRAEEKERLWQRHLRLSDPQEMERQAKELGLPAETLRRVDEEDKEREHREEVRAEEAREQRRRAKKAKRR